MFFGSLRKLNSSQLPTISFIPYWLRNTWKGSSYSTNESEPEPPQSSYCCESGCTNCVWLDYAERLLQYHMKRIQGLSNDNIQNSDKEDLINEIVNRLRQEVNQVDDQSVRAFLLTEIAIKKKELMKTLEKDI
ncbi:unnamed protein product [Heterobilharzia americana]|nr:unnamed protein product [Heterobilharzia americana]